MVFVSNPRVPSSVAVTMATFSCDLLYPANIIDQAIETRQTLSLALIQQWVGVNIIQRTLSDTWIITGLALYIHGLFIRHLLGNNEYRFRLKKDIDRCVHADQGEQLPLCQPGAIDPPSASTMAFMALKAPLVLHILDRYIAKSGTSKGLSRVIPRIFLASLSDELAGNMLSTAYFFRLCRKVSGMDMLSFQDQWIYGSGCPHLTIKTNFIRKKFLVEFTVNQQQPALQAVESLDAKTRDKVMMQKRPTPFFEGSLTVRIHEADGAPFEHLVDVKTASKTTPLPFNTKYKRTRRSGHVAARFSKLQDALAQAEVNDAAEAEQLQDVDRGDLFAYPPWDNDEDVRLAWRVHDWSEEEAATMLGESGGYEWIRVDPDCEWIAHFDIQEKPWFWISQLQGDRDVVAQLQVSRLSAD
jgi:transcription initiation factor TFIID subunit 2